MKTKGQRRLEARILCRVPERRCHSVVKTVYSLLRNPIGPWDKAGGEEEEEEGKPAWVPVRNAGLLQYRDRPAVSRPAVEAEHTQSPGSLGSIIVRDKLITCV